MSAPPKGMGQERVWHGCEWRPYGARGCERAFSTLTGGASECRRCAAAGCSLWSAESLGRRADRNVCPTKSNMVTIRCAQDGAPRCAVISRRNLLMNTECQRVANELASNLDGEAWYGESIREILNGVTAEQANARPVSDAHSIWEIVLHVDAWIRLYIEALEGTPIPEWKSMPKEMDWPPVTATGEDDWKQAVSRLFNNHLEMVERIKSFDDERLESAVPGRTYTFYRLFHGATLHAVYHGGQIALLKKVAA